MGFRGQPFAFESPAAAVAGMLASLRIDPDAREPEAVPLSATQGRILAQTVVADRDSPPFDHAAMDGFAVRTADLHAAAQSADGTPGAPLQFTVVAEARIGCAPPALPMSTGIPHRESEPIPSIRIATGAPLPPGADAILKREDVLERADGPRGTAFSTSLQVAIATRAGNHIRRRGENARAGAAVLEAGAVLSPAALGTLAAVGLTQPLIHRQLRIALITTGDEVVPPEATPSAFQIRNSNAPALAAMLAAHAWLDLVPPAAGRIAHASDDPGDLDAILREALETSDAVIITGGVSMGHRDPVLAAVTATGARVVFHGLPQRPGKPMLGAVLDTSGVSQPIFGLPGNPVSSLVTCARIVLPILAAQAGGAPTASAPRSVALPPSLRPRLVRLANPDGRSIDLWWHRLVRLSEKGEAHLLEARGSGDIISAGHSDGFVEVAPAPSTPLDDSLTGIASLPAVSSDTLFPFYQWPS